MMTLLPKFQDGDFHCRYVSRKFGHDSLSNFQHRQECLSCVLMKFCGDSFSNLQHAKNNFRQVFPCWLTHIQNIQHVKTTSSVSWRALLSDRNVDFKFLRYTKRNFLSAIDSFFYVQMLNKFTKFKPPLIEHNSPNLLVECQQYKWSNWSGYLSRGHIARVALDLFQA